MTTGKSCYTNIPKKEEIDENSRPFPWQVNHSVNGYPFLPIYTQSLNASIHSRHRITENNDSKMIHFQSIKRCQAKFHFQDTLNSHYSS